MWHFRSALDIMKMKLVPARCGLATYLYYIYVISHYISITELDQRHFENDAAVNKMGYFRTKREIICRMPKANVYSAQRSRLWGSLVGKVGLYLGSRRRFGLLPAFGSFKVRAPASRAMTQQREPEVKSCCKLVKLLLKLNRRLLPSK